MLYDTMLRGVFWLSFIPLQEESLSNLIQLGEFCEEDNIVKHKDNIVIIKECSFRYVLPIFAPYYSIISNNKQ